MPVPNEYQRASDDFYKFLTDARDTAGLTSTHMAYTMAQAVLQTFRRRLDIKDAIRFLNALPAGLRALFAADWDVEEPKRAFGDRSEMTREVQALRGGHNFSPDTAIKDVASAFRRNVDSEALDRVLAKLPGEAAEYWQA